MGKRTDDEDVQPPLVPMSEAEVKAAGLKLARKIEDEIAAIATTIRTQGK